MYGLTRGTVTLLGAAAAAVLVWLAVEAVRPLDDVSTGEYWTFIALLAAAGFVVPLSQLAGGWTKWGWPRLTLGVLLIGFLPAALVALWLIGYHQPGENELAERVRDWSVDLGVEGTLNDMGVVTPVAAFAAGLLFGLTFDTSGPQPRDELVAEPYEHRRPVAEPVPERRAPAARAAEADTRVVPPDSSEQETRVARPDPDPDAPPPRRGT